MKRFLWMLGALAVAALDDGCTTTAAAPNPPPAAAAGASLGNNTTPAPTTVDALTPAQLAQLHAVGLDDKAIAGYAERGQLAMVVTQVQGATMGNTATAMVAMDSGPMPPPPPLPGSGGGPNLGGFGAFGGRGLSGGFGGGGGGPRAKPPRTENLTATVDLWKTSAPPDESFGQYTYLLLARDDAGPNKAAMRERNLKLLQAALGRLDPLAEHDRLGTAHERLNVVLIPMKNAGPSGPHDDAFFAAVLENYDWTFASLMRTALKFEGQRGPFLYSAAERWDRKATVLPECIKQDLSDAPDSMVLVWWGEFLKQSSRPDFWQKDKMQQVALGLRNLIEKAAEQAGESQSAIKSVLALIGLPAGGKD